MSLLEHLLFTFAILAPAIKADAPLATIYHDFDLKGFGQLINSENCIPVEAPLKFHIRSIKMSPNVVCGFYDDLKCDSGLYDIDGTDIYILPSPMAQAIRCRLQ
ncbi:hypothetical protein LMH87_002813 [Akanthomyces muscarius]|uniref:Uncharacterized protein n=1 Tax=Akanthomyces muscarius TaxID=2231603 RepID=A0A9W8Q9A8_AKAMU|nr:hypothetical protein LMH87_002813 [Akanthomyces muscarius]KAJ4148338.1 hypothetical protein LMH87_002813 [Akanthomyces muscarius]